MSFSRSKRSRLVVSPYAARPLDGRLSEPIISSADRDLELQGYEWKVALSNSPNLVSFHNSPIPMLVPVAMYVFSLYTKFQMVANTPIGL